MKHCGLILGFVGIAFTASVATQARPDFSGVWSAAGSSITVKQDVKTVAVTTNGETRVYNLDGSDTHFDRKTERGVSSYTAQARWVGSALVIATTTVSPIGTWQDLEVYSLDYGPKLTVVRVVSQTTQGRMDTTTTTYGRTGPAVR